MSYADKRYIKLVKRVLKKGIETKDRTGVGTLSLFGERVKYDLRKGFPLLTTKRVWFNGVLHELIWFLKGDTNIKYLQNNKVHIWDEWADKDGNLGPVYGKQWRDWGGIDQIKEVVKEIKKNPTSRRLIVNAWNVSELKEMALPPCHLLFQFSVRGGEFLDCQVYQRSADLFLGVPFNIASYALLTHAVAHVTHLKVGTLTHVMGDCHIYLNHLDQVKEQVRRYEEEEKRPAPTLEINGLKDITRLKEAHITLNHYNPYGKIEGEVAV